MSSLASCVCCILSLNCELVSRLVWMSWNMRCSLVVYSNPHASLSLPIMDDSASSEADVSLINRFESIFE